MTKTKQKQKQNKTKYSLSNVFVSHTHFSTIDRYFVSAFSPKLFLSHFSQPIILSFGHFSFFHHELGHARTTSRNMKTEDRLRVVVRLDGCTSDEFKKNRSWQDVHTQVGSAIPRDRVRYRRQRSSRCGSSYGTPSAENPKASSFSFPKERG